LSEYIKANWTLGAVLHQERLKIELQNLIRDKLSHAFDNLDEVISWLEKAPKINASSVELKDQKISGDLLKRILRKEAFIYQTFYKSTQQHYAALLGGGVQ
jgi:hypothetical protein